MFSTTTTLLWLQFAYAVWQFVRVAKFFRIPSAFLHHTVMWLANQDGYGRPFSQTTFSLVIQGEKSFYPPPDNNEQLRSWDKDLNGGHFLQERMGSRYIVDHQSVQSVYILDRQYVYTFCSKVDIILPQVYIADVYSWPEGFDKFMIQGATLESYEGRALFVSTREHMLNQNFMRLLSIVPLMLQAKGLDNLSIYVSGAIIALDQLSYPANLLWVSLQDVLVNITRFFISRIKSLKRRNFISMFLSTVTTRLRYSDEVYRNFRFVRKNQDVLVFGTSCADYFFHEDIRVKDPPPQVNEFVELEREGYDSLDLVHGDVEHNFGIKVGSLHLEHYVNGAVIKSFFVGENFYNFIDDEHLHYGYCKEDQVPRMLMALKWIENNGGMPVTCDHSGRLHAVKFNSFVQMVANGYSPVVARSRRRAWIQ